MRDTFIKRLDLAAAKPTPRAMIIVWMTYARRTGLGLGFI
jgi:hypothetical protein